MGPGTSLGWEGVSSVGLLPLQPQAFPCWPLMGLSSFSGDLVLPPPSPPPQAGDEGPTSYHAGWGVTEG